MTDRLTVLLFTLAGFLAVLADPRAPAARLRALRLSAFACRAQDLPHDRHRDDRGVRRPDRSHALGLGLELGRDAAGTDHARLVVRPWPTELDYTFRAMGSDVRLLIGDRLLAGAPPPLEAADRERAFVWEFSDRLSRFEARQRAVGVEPRSATASAGLTAAPGRGQCRRCGQRASVSGLVDPTLVRALERSGYDHSLDGAEPASLAGRAGGGPAASCQLGPNPAARWRRIEVDDEACTIARPPGVMIDTGGTGKGLCADAVALRLERLHAIRRGLRRGHRRRRGGRAARAIRDRRPASR